MTCIASTHAHKHGKTFPGQTLATHLALEDFTVLQLLEAECTSWVVLGQLVTTPPHHLNPPLFALDISQCCDKCRAIPT